MIYVGILLSTYAVLAGIIIKHIDDMHIPPISYALLHPAITIPFSVELGINLRIWQKV